RSLRIGGAPPRLPGLGIAAIGGLGLGGGPFVALALGLALALGEDLRIEAGIDRLARPPRSAAPGLAAAVRRCGGAILHLVSPGRTLILSPCRRTPAPWFALWPPSAAPAYFRGQSPCGRRLARAGARAVQELEQQRPQRRVGQCGDQAVQGGWGGLGGARTHRNPPVCDR